MMRSKRYRGRSEKKKQKNLNSNLSTGSCFRWDKAVITLNPPCSELTQKVKVTWSKKLLWIMALN